MTAIAEPLTQDPLWSRVRAMFARAVAALGAPAAIAAVTLLSKCLRREIVAWLYPLESIVRRLLIAEAAELHRAELARAARGPSTITIPLRSLGFAHAWTAGLQTRTCPGVSERCASEDARSKMDCAHPETWRAQFSFALPRNPRVVPNARAPRILDLSRDYPTPPPPRAARIIRPEHAPFRLARRFEALRRVLANPLLHAQRLAHALAREVRRYSAVVRRAVLAGPRTDAYDRADPRLSIDALGAAWRAPEVFAPDSS